MLLLANSHLLLLAAATAGVSIYGLWFGRVEGFREVESLARRVAWSQLKDGMARRANQQTHQRTHQYEQAAFQGHDM